MVDNSKLNNIYDSNYLKLLIKNGDARIQRIIDRIHFNKTDVIGDFASGSGTLAWSIHNKVKEYYGIDTSLDFIEFSNKYANKLEITNTYFKCESIVQFCSSRLSFFDKAFTLDFSEHINDSDFNEIYKSIFKSLKPNGKLYLHTPNGNYFLEVFKKIGLITQTPGHVGIRNIAKLTNILKPIGFRYIKIYYFSHYIPILKSMHFLSYIPLTSDFFKARILMICTK